MKKRFVKLLALSVVGVMAVGLAACGSDDGSSSSTSGGSASAAEDEGSVAASGSSSSKSSSGETIGIVVKTATNAHFQDIAYGAMLAGKDLGVDVKVDNTSTESDVDGQIQKCEDMISSGVDALILTANDSDGVSAAVEAAHDADIPFVTVDTEITNNWGDEVTEYMPNYIGVDHEQMAYELACDVFDEIGGSGNVVILRGVDAASSSQERTAGFEEAIDEYPDITLLQSQSADYDQDTALSTMGDIIQADSDIDAVLCCNDLMAVGAMNAFEENGIDVGGDDGVVIAGIDGNYIALQEIDKGTIYATAYDWSILQGYYAVEQAYDLINGDKVDEYTYTPHTVITAENIDEYLPHGEEVDEWSMGSPIKSVSDYMDDFVMMGEDMGVENEVADIEASEEKKVEEDVGDEDSDTTSDEDSDTTSDENSEATSDEDSNSGSDKESPSTAGSSSSSSTNSTSNSNSGNTN